MSYAGNTLSLIRSFFSRKNEIPQPETMQSLIWKSMYPEMGGSAAGGVGPLTEGNAQLQNALGINTDLMTRFADYADMSSYPECFTALNIYADEATQLNTFNHDIVTFESPDEQIQAILEYTFNKRLRIQENIWSIARVLAKYGNTFKEVVVKDGEGVVKLLGHRPQFIRRIQDEEGHLYGFVKDPTMSFKMTTESFLKRIMGMEEETHTQDFTKVYEPWEMVHFRLDGEEGDDLYGNSILEGSRWAWKRLQQMEDAMVIHKLTRAQQRYVYYVDVGDVPPNEARKVLNQVKQDFKKQRITDPNCLTGDTLIPCLDGKHRSMKELARDFADKKFWVYSFDLSNNKIVPGLAHSPVLSGESIPIYRVRLDSGAVIRCTADHPFLMRDGEYKKAADLERWDSLMPLYLQELKTKCDYIGFRDIDGANKLVHQMVAEEIYSEDYKLKKLHAHHINGDKKDNRPENIKIMTMKEHSDAHNSHRDGLQKGRDSYCKRIETDPEFRKEISNRIISWREREPEEYRLSQEKCVEARLQYRKNNEAKDEMIYDKIISLIADELKQKPYLTSRLICDILNANPYFIELWSSISEIRTDRINASSLTYIFRRRKIQGFREFSKQICGDVKKQIIFDGKHKKKPEEFANYNDAENWDKIIKIIEEIVVKDPLVCLEHLCSRLNECEEFLICWRALSKTLTDYVIPPNMSYVFKRNGFDGFGDFKIKVTGSNRRRFAKHTTDVLNHKVVEVEFDGYEDVYDLTVDKYHNFAVTAGVFVHNTGSISFKYNPLSNDEDIFIARRKDKRATEVEVLSGLDNQTAGDAEYFRAKLIAGLGIPKSYIGYDETIGRANLGQQDAKMARTTMRLQRALKAGLRQIAEVDFAARNIDPDAVDFEINLTIPSGVLEIAHVEVQKAKTELASAYQGLNVPDEWIWKEVLGFSDDEYERMKLMMGKGEEPKGEPKSLPSGGGSTDLGAALSPETPSDQEGPLPGADEEPAAPEGETPPEGGKPPLEASKYRKIAKDRQLMESRHKEVVSNIISTDKAMEGRIRELKGLVQDIRQSMPRKK